MNRRDTIMSWLRAGLRAVDPRVLTSAALAGESGPLTVIAIGKAAPEMCWGAYDAVGHIEGLCIASRHAQLPDGVELIVGDHPIPGESSLRAGMRALEVSAEADLALISGGGSALCEVPADGLDLQLIADVNQRMLKAGTSIEVVNMVRSHLSLIKGGGLGALPTLILSDVAGASPAVVSSGPTMASTRNPEMVLDRLADLGFAADHDLEDAVRRPGAPPNAEQRVLLIGDGRDAATAIAKTASTEAQASVADGWIRGDYLSALEKFLEAAATGVTVAAGEASVPVEDGGVGGRNTHTALSAARLIAGTGIWFAALATDGGDGNSGSAGAIVDGTTIIRGGPPDEALRTFDSATYLRQSRDLIETGPTGTNVADVWLVWKPDADLEPILASS